MKILTYPNDALLVKCKAVDKITDELKATAQEMYKTMLAADGIGLAAPQVGLDIRLLVLEDGGKPLYMFNPLIMKKSKEMQYETEGCLSFPDEWKKIKRCAQVHVRFRNINGKMTYRVLTGMLAIAAQHEIDHLNGKLFNEYEETN